MKVGWSWTQPGCRAALTDCDEHLVAGHVNATDQRDVFEQICDRWRLDAGRVEMVLQHRFGGTVQIDAPWREHDPLLILASVRSAVC